MIIKYHSERDNQLWYEFFIDRGVLPDWVLRRILRFKLQLYSRMVSGMKTLDLDKTRERFLSECKSSFIAIDTELANSQHYELPTMFYEKILGKNMKYSGSIWGRNGANLDDADNSTLDIYICLLYTSPSPRD